MLSILIPTKNRSEFLIRQLSYYALSGFAGHILIGDSSDALHSERVRRFVASLRDARRIDYVHAPGLDDRETLVSLAERIRTPYVAYAGDDDFLIVREAERCVAFLEASPDFVAAHGAGRLFTVSPGEAYGMFLLGSRYEQPAYSSDRAWQRLRQLLNTYRPPLFSVHRAAVWRQMWRHTALIEDRAFAAEILPSCLSAVLGSIKYLPGLYLLRQVHRARYALPSKAAWRAAPGWQRDFPSVCGILARALRDQGDGHADSDRVARLFQEGYLCDEARAGCPATLGPGALVRRGAGLAARAVRRAGREVTSRAARAIAGTRVRSPGLQPLLPRVLADLSLVSQVVGAGQSALDRAPGEHSVRTRR